MTGVDGYQSYRPSAHDTRRELTAAGNLDDSAWRASSQALVDFLSRTYEPREVERALADAVQDKRFGAPGVPGQRNNLKLYFAVSKLMQKYGVRQLPWSQRELDRLLDDFAREPSIREIDVDFRSVMHKLVRNGAFDHLAGLTTTIVSTQYLPGVKRLMERRQGEHVTARPNESRSTSRISDRPTPAPPTVTATGRNSPAKTGSEASKETSKELAQRPKEPSKRPVVAKEKPTEQPKAVLRSATTDAPTKPKEATAGSPRQAKSIVAIKGPSTYHAIVQEGLEILSEANMMPFVHQYELLNDVLRMLERSCFFWASRIVSGVLKKKKWTAWQQVSILEWLEYFALPDTPLNITPDARSLLVNKTIPGLKKMHDDTITRKALPINAVISMMEHAQALFKALGDDACRNILESIRDSLKNTESRSTETKSRLKLEFQQSAVAINQKYVRMMEDELKEKAAAMNADLENHLDSIEWGLKFVAPSDDYYSIYHSPTMRPGNASTTTHPTGSETGIIGISSPKTAAGPANGYQSEVASGAAPSGSLRQEIPPTGSLEYEQYWLDYSSHNKGQIPVRIIPQALGLGEKAWEDFQLAAVKIMAQCDLTDVRARDQKPKLTKAMQAFQTVHQHIFQQIKIKAFTDFLCGITFKHAQHAQSVSQARRAKAQQPSVESDPSEAHGGWEAGRRLEALKSAPTSSVYTRSNPGWVRPPRPGADEFFDPARTIGKGSTKRSLSPDGDRNDVQKKVKMEPSSQDDLILLEHRTDAEIEAAAFEALMRNEAIPSVESIRGTGYEDMSGRRSMIVHATSPSHEMGMEF